MRRIEFPFPARSNSPLISPMLALFSVTVGNSLASRIFLARNLTCAWIGSLRPSSTIVPSRWPPAIPKLSGASVSTEPRRLRCVSSPSSGKSPERNVLAFSVTSASIRPQRSDLNGSSGNTRARSSVASAFCAGGGAASMAVARLPVREPIKGPRSSRSSRLDTSSALTAGRSPPLSTWNDPAMSLAPMRPENFS